jgi:hypothetical protein
MFLLGIEYKKIVAWNIISTRFEYNVTKLSKVGEIFDIIFV